MARRSALTAICLALSLTACADGGPTLLSSLVPAPAGGVSTPPAAPSDPLALFALATPPGGAGQVNLAGGTEPARIARIYQAASGRECREVVLGSGRAERSQLVCTDAAEGTRLTPPLLRGGRAG